jgi:NAD(P)-dependent dehydrogenase (short-subunit alcohol dehydrogenase family)
MSGTCIVTGGARGIGRATALLAAERGYRVVVNYRERADAASAVVEAIQSGGGQAVAVGADVAVEADIVRLFGTAEDTLGGPVTALVNSAGIGYGSPCVAFERDPIARMMELNVVGLMLCCREAARRMALSRGGQGGAIVNVSSMAATIGGRPGASAYAASKAAVDVFTTGLAKELAPEGIRVNAVRPGMTLTDMTADVQADPARLRAVAATIPMQRCGEPEEVAAAILFLLSDAASYVSGTHLNASGGGFLVGR